MRLDLSLRRSTMYVENVEQAEIAPFLAQTFELQGTSIKMDSLKPSLATTSNSFIKGAFGRDLMRQTKALRLNFKTMEIRLE